MHALSLHAPPATSSSTGAGFLARHFHGLNAVAILPITARAFEPRRAVSCRVLVDAQRLSSPRGPHLRRSC